MYTPMAFTMELDQFISGERFQALADVSIIPYGNDVGESECGFVKDQQKNNNYNAFYYNENTTKLPPEVQNAKKIFVNTWTLNKFFKYIFPLLENEYVFISHNSDISFDNKCEHFLNDKRVIKWYSQNIGINHPKLFSIPIGLGNQQYPHGNISLLNSIILRNHTKDNLVYKNFSIDTNQSERRVVDVITAKNNINMYASVPQNIYFEHLARSKFVINPKGNGPDCHRVWECLYLGAIPILVEHISFSQFKHLPILFIQDWNDVTVDFLLNKAHTIQNASYYKELDMRHWKTII